MHPSNETQFSALLVKQDITYFAFRPVQIVSAAVAILLDVGILLLLHQRRCSRPDLISLKNFATGNLICAIGRFGIFMHRFIVVVMQVEQLQSWQCVLFFYFPLETVGSTYVSCALFVLSLERMLFFLNTQLDNKIFSRLSNSRLTLLILLPCCVNNLIWVSMALMKNRQVSSLCVRHELSSKIYFKIYTLFKICCSILESLCYIVAFFAFMNQRKIPTPTTLSYLRQRRDRKIFFSLIAVFFCSAIAQLLPWLLIYLISDNPKYRKISVISYRLETFYLPFSALFFLSMHPDLTSQLKHHLLKIPNFKKLFTTSFTNRVVYIG
ncbi:hypothetical protein T4A_14433 [Trichinella pseudospiralis]|uniref:G-protein coupled receptors family 1 profile domain-containing protein n=1 Tax=Trichinella pseudospiralis TaxID=6337 RepID=A0A0V1EZK1_TRIPS|nr:hypothetical protein T4E_8889 [Trichinella pseudospiralis]KRY79127.1 hypothetical protein T4A_14433 [Trichinella pseudospiralis]